MGEEFPAALVLLTMTEIADGRNGRIAARMQKVIGCCLFATLRGLGKGLGGAEGEAVGYRGELVAATNPVRSESALKDPAHREDEGTAPREEDAIDGAGIDARGLEQRVDGAFDGVEVVCYP